MLKLRLSLTAEHDLEKIWRYTVSEWTLEQAEKYVALIEKGAVLILDNPYIGKTSPDVKAGYRALQVEKHLIFYRVGAEFIDVLGILMSAWTQKGIWRTPNHRSKRRFNLKFIPRGLAAGSLAMGFLKGRGAALPFGRPTGFIPRGGEIKLSLSVSALCLNYFAHAKI